MKAVRCKSGLKGWRCHLRENYKDYSDFLSYDNIYHLSKKLGFQYTRDAWDANPLIQGSTNPSDLELAKDYET